MSRIPCTVILLLALATGASAQVSHAEGPTTSPADASIEDSRKWHFSAALYTYIVPDQDDYVQPTITADYDRLHLEARYNYEALDTGSVWLGCNFAGGEKIEWEVTPMLGGVMGNTVGVAPGYRGHVAWWKLTLFSEGEYLFDTRDSPTASSTAGPN